MTRIRRINVSQVEGGGADNTDINEIRPNGETAFYIDDNNKLTLMMFDGVRTNQKSKVLSTGVLYGSNADAGDGSGSDTIKLIPDAALGTDQYIVVDPTGGEPGHIHLRAGGTQDSSTADLYLGGEQTFVRVSDTYDNVVIRTSTVGEGITPYTWTFDTVGDLNLPDNGGIVFDRADTTIRVGMGFHIASGEGISLDAIDQTAILTLTGAGNGPVNQTYNKTNDTLYTGNDNSSVTVENQGGTWFVLIDGDAKYTSNDLLGWALSTGPGPVPVGVLSNGYKSWGFSPTGNLTLPNDAVIRTDGDNVEVGGVTNFNVEAAGVVNIYTDDGAHQWQFGDDGDLTVPGGIVAEYQEDFTITTSYLGMSSPPGPVDRTFTFTANGNLTFPDGTTQTSAYIPTITTGNDVVASPGGIGRNGMSIWLTDAGQVQMSFDSNIDVKGRYAINGGATTVINPPNGVTQVNTRYNIGTALNLDDHLTATIVDSSFHNVYRLTVIVREKDTTPGSEFTTAYVIIEELQ